MSDSTSLLGSLWQAAACLWYQVYLRDALATVIILAIYYLAMLLERTIHKHRINVDRHEQVCYAEEVTLPVLPESRGRGTRRPFVVPPS
jgi:hypothetical protein